MILYPLSVLYSVIIMFVNLPLESPLILSNWVTPSFWPLLPRDLRFTFFFTKLTFLYDLIISHLISSWLIQIKWGPISFLFNFHYTLTDNKLIPSTSNFFHLCAHVCVRVRLFYKRYGSLTFPSLYLNPCGRYLEYFILFVSRHPNAYSISNQN